MSWTTDLRRAAGPFAALLAAGALAAVGGPAPAAAQTWTSLGPAPITDRQWTGRIAALALSPSKKNRYWAGAASGGVWRTTSGGGGWKATTDELPNLAIGALAIDPADERVLYAGSGEANYAYHSLYGAGLYKSTDGGKSWRVLAAAAFAGRTFSRLEVSPDGTVWAAVARAGGSLRGNEGGRGHPQAGGPTGIFRSLDGGETWERVRGGLPKIAASDVDIAPGAPGTVFASFGRVFGHNKNGVYRSTDGGRRFMRLDLGVPGRRLGRLSLAVSPGDPSRIYVLAAGPVTRATPGGFAPGGADTLGVFRSDDGGDSWTQLDPGNLQPSFGQYYSAIAAHPSDADVFVIGGLDLLVSEDGGATYRFATPPHVDLHDAGFDAAGRLVTASDGGVHRSDDLGRTWVNRNRKLGSVQFYPGLSVHPTDPEAVIGGTQDNGTDLRQDADDRWVMVFGGDGGWTAIHPDDPRIVFVQFQGVGNLFRSSDGGRSFSQVAAGIDRRDRTAFQAPFAFDPIDPSRLFYATQRLYRSVDGGFTWNPLSDDLTPAPWAVRSLAVAPADPEVIYAVTSDGRLLVSVDGGATFDRRRDGIGGWPRIMRQIAVDSEDASRAWVADMRFGGAGVLATTDRGRTWRSVAGDLPDLPVSTVAVHRAGDERLLFAGADRGVWLSRDEGASWIAYGRRLPNAPVMDIVVDAPRGRLVISTLGRGMWTAPLP